jgi:cell division protein FtsW
VRIAHSVNAARQLVRKHRPDYQLVIYTGVLLLFGLIVLYAISPARVETLESSGASIDEAHFMQRQLLYLIAGIIAFFAANLVPLEKWKQFSGKLLIAALISCVLLVFFGAINAPLALCTGGACRWFNLGIGTFQPAELLKFAVLLFFAVFLARRVKEGNVNNFHETLIPVGIITGIAVIFVIGFQKDMGTGLSLIGIIAAMLYLAGINKRMGLIVLNAILALSVLFIIIAPHRLARVTTFLGQDTSEDAKTSSYHINQAKIALGTGGLFGLGLGKNVQAFGYLPEAPNDSIFAVMGEAFGFVGVVAIVIFMTGLLLRLLHILDRTEEYMYRLIIAGVFGWLTTHIVLNIGAMVGLIPLTGITLPLLSFGGTSLLFIMLALGLVFNISRYTVHGKIIDDETEKKASSGGRRWVGRTRNTAPVGHRRTRSR